MTHQPYIGLFEITRDVSSRHMPNTNAFIGIYDGNKIGFLTCLKAYKLSVGQICNVTSTEFSRGKLNFKLTNKYLERRQLVKPSPLQAPKELPNLDCYPFKAFQNSKEYKKIDPPYIGVVANAIAPEGYESLPPEILYLPIHPDLLDNDGKIKDEYFMFNGELNISHPNLRWDKHYNIFEKVGFCCCNTSECGGFYTCHCETKVVYQIKLMTVRLNL